MGVLIKGTIEAFITFQGTLSSWWTRIAIAAMLCFFIVLQSIFTAAKEKNKNIKKARNAALCGFPDFFNIFLFYYYTIFIPKIMPVISSWPKEYLSFDKTVIFIKSFDNLHFFLCQRIFCDTLQIHGIILFF